MKPKALKLFIFSAAIVCLTSFTVNRQTASTAKNAVLTENHTHSTLHGRECPNCKGNGRIQIDCSFCDNGNRECQLCYGKCEIRCTYCQGGGSFRCNSCAGRGYFGEEECSNCKGSGEIQCESCKGTKITPCPSCGASGLVACLSCGGKGYTDWKCPECDGSGVVDDD
ncbi:MAG: hypothetical protein J6X58_00015 [Bacteroidales bacterium]|nr:hypothetical protein [Bacteroidales bacterium]